MGKIFISYRREDTPGMPRQIYEKLVRCFPGEVFLDIEEMPLGVDFPDYLGREVRTSFS